MKNVAIWVQETVVAISMGMVVLTAAAVLATVGMFMAAAVVVSGGNLRQTA